MPDTPLDIYHQQKQRFELQLSERQARHNRFGWMRLALLLVTSIAAYQVFVFFGAWAWLAVGVGLGLFLWLVSVDADNDRHIAYYKQLVHINSEELLILEGKIAHREDGAVFLPSEHSYAYDLDLLGKHSLYQLVNRCSGEQGRQLLAANLLAPISPEDIMLRQEAAKELAPMYQWRQHLQAKAAATPLTKATEKKLQQWLAQPIQGLNENFWRWFVPVYSIIACGLALAAILEWIPGRVFSAALMGFILFSFTVGRKGTQVSQQLSGVVGEMDTLQQVLESVEKPDMKSTLLHSLQQQLGVGEIPASQQIKELKNILNRFDLRLNVFVFLLLNSLLLWDVRQLLALKRWQLANQHRAVNWFGVVAQYEVLASLATLRFNQPAWAEPQLLPGYFGFSANALGHPLISEQQRVTSDFKLEGSGKIALITGSNMAGKSTFLRSLGVNTVLAQMGAVVCAQQLSITPVALMSSMRIADNLAESTSTFYAELKKLKTIIEAVKAHRPVFVLLDEILRGTNSLDRHTGSGALIRQLLRENRVAVLATHDVELAKLETEHPRGIANYHFDVQVAGQELYFDYKLKQGVCTNLNASVLMQKIGIEL